MANDINYLDETKKYSREVAAEYCEEVAREIRALDPEATQAFEALVKERDKLLAKLARAETREILEVIDERDAAEEALSQAYYLIKGESPQWSNNFGHDQALMDIDDAQKCLRAEVKEAEVLRERERKLRELVNEWERIPAARMMNGPKQNDAYHQCAIQLRAVLAETEG